MPALDKTLRKAVVELPASRKDKLLLQLLTANPVLQEQLAYELLEGEDALDTRRQILQAHLQTHTQGFYYNATELLICLRQVCPLLAHHVKITNDVEGEIRLLLQLLQETLTHQKEHLHTLSGSNEALGQFLAKRLEEALQKLAKLHEDLYVEFEDEVNAVLPLVHASAAGYAARKLGLPIKWK
ncbi:hypothetical protein TH61_04545 [Rufibacter sp. DG15C]|uniref:hypothetical protein n=1 Tax=Rufibacter sp. DG15C TaxID=1379909 RepID=UPI00078BF225|nr:hypothetical protein [Rufibacter sp. DG15C]AMM50592.1 hypothetical protein TH61_04545 [Rufibacter sp. DG15C]